jgi:hypothetical protein
MQSGSAWFCVGEHVVEHVEELGIEELSRRDIDRECRRIGLGALPLRGLGTSRGQDKLI